MALTVIFVWLLFFTIIIFLPLWIAAGDDSHIFFLANLYQKQGIG